MNAAAFDPPERFVTEEFFGAVPYVFGRDNKANEAFHSELAAKLAVTSADIRLVGSARLGFSLNRDHLLRRFGTSSDLDIVIVSSQRFDETWDELADLASTTALSDEAEKRRLKKTREFLPDGYFRPDFVPLASRLAKDWFPRLAGPFETPEARIHPVKGWLFKSWRHAHRCYARYLARVQPDLKSLLERQGVSNDHQG